MKSNNNNKTERCPARSRTPAFQMFCQLKFENHEPHYHRASGSSWRALRGWWLSWWFKFTIHSFQPEVPKNSYSVAGCQGYKSSLCEVAHRAINTLTSGRTGWQWRMGRASIWTRLVICKMTAVTQQIQWPQGWAGRIRHCLPQVLVMWTFPSLTRPWSWTHSAHSPVSTSLALAESLSLFRAVKRRRVPVKKANRQKKPSNGHDEAESDGFLETSWQSSG